MEYLESLSGSIAALWPLRDDIAAIMLTKLYNEPNIEGLFHEIPTM